MAKKKIQKGTYSSKKGARDAAIKKGLKEEEFEICDGPKGFTIRLKKEYAAVPGAKLHVGPDPEKTLKDLLSPVEGHPDIFVDNPTGRFRYRQEEESVSLQSFETVDAAEESLKKFCDTVLCPKPNDTAVNRANEAELELQKKYPLPDKFPSEPLDPALEQAQAEAVEDSHGDDLGGHPHDDLPADRYSVKLEQAVNNAEVVGKGKCKCGSMVPIVSIRSSFINVGHEELRITGHGNPNTDEDCEHAFEVFTGELEELTPPKQAPVARGVTPPWLQNGLSSESFKPHELTKIKGTELNTLVHEKPGTVPHTKKSTIENPSKFVWQLADEMIAANPSVDRKEVIAEAVRRGVAFYTARTQYQQWSTARRESIAHAAEANKK